MSEENREKRDRELIAKIEELHAERNFCDLNSCIAEVINSPASSWFLTDDAIYHLLFTRRRMESRHVKDEQKRDLRAAYLQLCQTFKLENESSLIRLLSQQPAPRYYLTEETAKQIYYRSVRQRASRAKKVKRGDIKRKEKGEKP